MSICSIVRIGDGAALAPLKVPAQQNARQRSKPLSMLLNFIVRDKKGKPVTDPKTEDLNVLTTTSNESHSSAW
jgi:hypothetical protein